MYVRTVSRRAKDGSTIRYLQLAHNERHPQTGTPVAKVVYTFGREDQVDRAALQRLVQSISRFLEPTDAAQVRAAVEEAGLQFHRSRALGGCWLLQQMWTALGLDRVVSRVAAAAGAPAELERAVFAMVANRALAPSSKLSVTDWVAGPVYVPGWDVPPLPHDARDAERKRRANVLYAAMDLLAGAEDKVQEQVFWAVSEGSLVNLEVDLLYFDTTSIYWESPDLPEPDDEDDDAGVRRRGHSKDHRPELPQVVVGLAVTRDGLPVRCWVWSGNTADVTVIRQVKDDLIGWKLGRVITVVDCGFTSEENLRTLQLNGGHYIAGERMRSGKAGVEAALQRPGRYQRVRHNLEVKEIVVGDGEARRRYVLVRNPEEAERDRERREQRLAELRARLAELRQVEGEEHTKAVCALRAHQTLGRYLTTDGSGRLKVDQDKVRAEERLDGKYLLRTSDDTLSPEDVALGYRQLMEVESAFRTLKTGLEMRPVYHRLDQRIRAHVLLCWLALLLVRIAEVKTRRSWPGMRRELDQMHLIEFSGPSGSSAQRTASTQEQRRILTAIGVSEPPVVFAAAPGTAPTP